MPAIRFQIAACEAMVASHPHPFHCRAPRSGSPDSGVCPVFRIIVTNRKFLSPDRIYPTQNNSIDGFAGYPCKFMSGVMLPPMIIMIPTISQI
jgi:hypothetical protein